MSKRHQNVLNRKLLSYSSGFEYLQPVGLDQAFQGFFGEEVKVLRRYHKMPLRFQHLSHQAARIGRVYRNQSAWFQKRDYRGKRGSRIRHVLDNVPHGNCIEALRWKIAVVQRSGAYVNALASRHCCRIIAGFGTADLPASAASYVEKKTSRGADVE